MFNSAVTCAFESDVGAVVDTRGGTATMSLVHYLRSGLGEGEHVYGTRTMPSHGLELRPLIL